MRIRIQIFILMRIRIRDVIPDPGSRVEKIPDPEQKTEEVYLSHKSVTKLSEMWNEILSWIPNPDCFPIWIPIQGRKDPGSGSAKIFLSILNP